jgi:hypothetical protein
VSTGERLPVTRRVWVLVFPVRESDVERESERVGSLLKLFDPSLMVADGVTLSEVDLVIVCSLVAVHDAD